MAKVLWREDEEQFEHKGCMTGIFHALDYQYWHSNVKKILPHKKHNSLIKRKRRYKRVSDDQDPFEVLKLLDAKTSHILVDKSNKNTNFTQKRSLKARIKALVSEDTDKEQDSNFVTSPKLQRTYSIHHLESNEWVHPIIFFPENITESEVNSKRHDNIKIPEIKDSRDILEIFEVDRELFLDILEVRSQDFDTKPKLSKSGSFPTAYKSGSRNLLPMKLNDKVNEVFPISKGEKWLENDLNKENGVIRFKRISSLKESVDRYSNLFDFSDDKETILRSSRSLKLIKGSENVQESSFLTKNQEFRDNYFVRNSSQNERNQEDCECLNEVVDEGDDFSENEYSEKITGESPVLATEICPPYGKVQISQGFQENLEKEIKTDNSKKHMESSIKHCLEHDDFTYVKQILERSGFIKNGFEQTWYSPNQPLDPYIFQEIESQYFHDPELFAKEIDQLSYRLLIFDLVDEVLITMFEKSSTYYPKELSSFCHIRHVPIRSLVLDEVWKRVSQMVNVKHDMNESLDDIVGRDLGSNDGWMNLQLDSECVGLDLEDLILDQVLDELLFDV